MGSAARIFGLAGALTALLAVAVRAQSAAPVITSSLVSDDAAFGNGDYAPAPYWTYHIAATNSPASYGVSGLRSVDTFDASTGLIGISTQAPGRFIMKVSATNAAGTGSADVQVTVHGLPTSLSVGNETGPYGVGSTVRIQVQFNEPVYVTGTPAADAGAHFKYESGSGTRTLIFAYAVSPGDNSEITYFATLDFTAGTMTDASGISVNPEVPGPMTHAWDVFLIGHAFSHLPPVSQSALRTAPLARPTITRSRV